MSNLSIHPARYLLSLNNGNARLIELPDNTYALTELGDLPVMDLHEIPQELFTEELSGHQKLNKANQIKVLLYIQKNPNGVTESELSRNFRGIKCHEMTKIKKSLLDSGMVTSVKTMTGGRSKTYWYPHS